MSGRNPWVYVLAIWAMMASLATAALSYDRWKSRSTVSSDSAVINDFDRLRFIREWADRLYTFESKTYRTSQTVSVFLLSESLRQARLDEIDRLAPKIEKERISQVGRLRRLREIRHEASDLAANSAFEAIVEIRLDESGAVRNLTAKLEFSLEESPRSIDNPWGLKIKDFRQDIVAAGSADVANGTKLGDVRSTLELQSGDLGLILGFPCSVERVEKVTNSKLKVRLTAFDVSEIEVSSPEVLSQPERLKVQCGEREFALDVMNVVHDSNSSRGRIWYQSFSLESGRLRPKPSFEKSKAQRKLEKTIEEQLGFVSE